MPKMIFVNLPVKDLAAATRFYKAIGCEQNMQFSNEQDAMMVWSDTISFMLLTHEYFATFTSKRIPDAQQTCQVLLCLSRDSREDVDTITKAAAAAGGKADVRAPIDMGFMYNRAFQALLGCNNLQTLSAASMSSFHLALVFDRSPSY